MSSRGFIGAGDLYIARYNPIVGAFEEFQGPFETDKFEIGPKSDNKDMVSKGRQTYGQIIASVPIPKPTEFKLSLNEANSETLSMALFGTVSEVNRGAGTATDEVVTAKRGFWVQLANQNIVEAGFVLKNSAGTDTYELGVDYKVNWRLGMLECLAGGAIADAASLKASYTFNAISGTSIAGGTQTQVRAKLRLDGINFADSLPCIVNVFEAVMSPSSAFDFLKSDFANIDLSGRLITPEGMEQPFTVEFRDAP